MRPSNPELPPPAGAPNADPPTGAPWDELWARVEGSLAEERGLRAWLRSRPTGVRVALVCGVVATLAVAHGVWARRSDWQLPPGGALLFVAAVVVLAIGMCVRVVLAPLSRSFRPFTARASAVLLLIPVLAAVAPELRFGVADGGPAAASLGAAAGCFVYGGVLALGVCAALWCVDRGELSFVRLVPAVVCAGLAAHLILQIHCANDHPTHLLLGHASIGFVWLFVGLGLRAASLPGTRSK